VPPVSPARPHRPAPGPHERATPGNHAHHEHQQHYERPASLRATPGVQDVDGLRLRWIGHRVRAETGIVVDSRLGIVEAHAIAHIAQHRLLHEVPKLDDVTVHVNPSGRPGDEHHALTAHHRSAT